MRTRRWIGRRCGLCRRTATSSPVTGRRRKRQHRLPRRARRPLLQRAARARARRRWNCASRRTRSRSSTGASGSPGICAPSSAAATRTIPEHLPAAHRAHLEWSPQRLIRGAGRRAVVRGVVVRILETRPHPGAGLPRLPRPPAARRATRSTSTRSRLHPGNRPRRTKL